EGNVDYRAQSYVQTIKKGDVICDVYAPVEGTPGVMVTGQVIKPPPVKPAVLPRGSNTALDEEGLHLVATMSGHLLYHTNAFQVKSILQVPGNVDYSTGNINFLGDVHIAGDVREKFTVRATGTVTIDGLVEAATVEADGDIIVTKGVLGDNKALLKSKKSVKAKYLENCVVYSGDCTFADCIINSEIYSDQRISVLTGRGTILGGSLTAAGQIEANIIGSQSGRKTEIVLGVLPYVQKEQDDNQGSKEEENKKHADLRLRKSVLALKEAKLVKRQQELMEMKVDRARCRLEAGTIYPTTILQIGAAVRKIEEVWKGCTAVYDSQTKDIEIF
ncbi:MAG: FapA family protein, partial [Pygmaiobacter massiliensis]|nr:FapA family protein [Pygmaiobacter massiliensis]